MKTYSDFNSMFNAQSGVKTDLSVFNEDYAVFASKEGGSDAGQIVFEMDNADDPTKIGIFYVPMDWKLGDSLDHKKYHKYPEYVRELNDGQTDDDEWVNFFDSWNFEILESKDRFCGHIINPKPYDDGNGLFDGVDADSFCRKMADESAPWIFDYDWRARNFAEDCRAKAEKYLSDILYRKNKKAMAEYLANGGDK